jgi:hypothetical protein
VEKHSEGHGNFRFTGVAILIGGIPALLCCAARGCSAWQLIGVVLLYGVLGVGSLVFEVKCDAWEKRHPPSCDPPTARGIRQGLAVGTILAAAGTALAFWSLEWGVTVATLGLAIIVAVLQGLWAWRSSRSKPQRNSRDTIHNSDSGHTI